MTRVGVDHPLPTYDLAYKLVETAYWGEPSDEWKGKHSEALRVARDIRIRATFPTTEHRKLLIECLHDAVATGVATDGLLIGAY